MDKNNTNNTIQRIFHCLMKIENLYLKFILTVIAGALVFIALELTDKNFYSSVDIIHGSIGVDGTVRISGEVDTYEQNTIIRRTIKQ